MTPTHTHGTAEQPGHRGRLTAVLGITVTVLVIEVVGSVVSGSVALIADAAHLLTDVAGLSLGLLAAIVADKPASQQRT